MINGVTQLIKMKADVLDGFDTIKVCTHYDVDGERIDYMPYDIVSTEVKPVYKDIPGWKTDLTQLSSIDEIPAE